MSKFSAKQVEEIVAQAVAEAVALTTQPSRNGKAKVAKSTSKRQTKQAAVAARPAPKFADGASESLTDRALNGDKAALALLTPFGQARVAAGRKLGITSKKVLKRTFAGITDIEGLAQVKKAK